MKKRDYIAAWLHDGYARLFLGGAPPVQGTTSRWVIAGQRHEDDPIGVWIEVARVEERRSDGKRIIYTVSPNMCLVRWDGIITIQRIKKGMTPEIGILPHVENPQGLPT